MRSSRGWCSAFPRAGARWSSATPPSMSQWSSRRWRESPTVPFAGCAGVWGRTGVSEMVTSRAVERKPGHAGRCVRGRRSPRSVQLYGVDPAVMAQAVRIIAGGGHGRHIDLNGGVSGAQGHAARRWRGAAVNWICSACDRACGGRQCRWSASGHGQDAHGDRRGPPDLPGRRRIAADEGLPGSPLHARTAAQMYSGQAHWSAITDPVTDLHPLPVLGNGDIWTAQDAWQMIQQTGCAGW